MPGRSAKTARWLDPVERQPLTSDRNRPVAAVRSAFRSAGRHRGGPAHQGRGRCRQYGQHLHPRTASPALTGIPSEIRVARGRAGGDRYRPLPVARERRLCGRSIVDCCEAVEVGALLSYDVDPREAFHRAAALFDKLMRGTSPLRSPLNSRRSSSWASTWTARALELRRAGRGACAATRSSAQYPRLRRSERFAAHFSAAIRASLPTLLRADKLIQ
jgi:hypothetical protein